MILINITFSVDKNICNAFLAFLQEKVLPAAKKRGMKRSIISKVRAEEQENYFTRQMSESYALQMIAADEAAAEGFMADILAPLCEEMAKAWGPSIGMFETILDIISTEDE